VSGGGSRASGARNARSFRPAPRACLHVDRHGPPWRSPGQRSPSQTDRRRPWVSFVAHCVIVEIEGAEIVLQFLAEFENRVVVLIVIPVQNQMVAGDGRGGYRFKQRE